MEAISSTHEQRPPPRDECYLVDANDLGIPVEVYNYAGRVAEPADGWVYFSWKEQEGKLEGQLYILYADKSPRTVTNIRPHSDFRRLAYHSIGYYDGPWTSAVYKFVFNSLGECQELMRLISFVQRHLEELEDPDNSSWRRRRHYSLLAPSA